MSVGSRGRPRPFAEDWSIQGTASPPTTVANPLAVRAIDAPSLRPRSVGARFRRFRVEELAGVPNVDFYWGKDMGGLDLSPDGAEVAFSWNRSGAFEIYSAPFIGDRIIQLTAAGARSVVPKWSPRGRWIAFLRDADGNENLQLWLVDHDGLKDRSLTSDPSTMHRDPEWSPDGRAIAYVANPGGGGSPRGDRKFGVHVIDMETGEQRRLTESEHDDHHPHWSPDGSTIVFWSRREAVRTNSDLYLVPASGGPARLLPTRGGLDGESRDASWSPDGTTIAFTTNVRGRYEIAFAYMRDGEVQRIERLGATPFDDEQATWRPDGRGVMYRHDQESSVSIRRVFTISHADEALADVPGVHYSPWLLADSESLVVIRSAATHPADVYVRPAGATALHPITNSLPDTIDPVALVEPVHVRYPGAGGEPIPALVYVPHEEAIEGSGPPPAVVYVHGGPTAQHLRQWDPVPQILANHGYAVLAPNIRGSTGYGRPFQEANRHDWGGKDLEDVVRGADWLAREGIADGQRIGIRGGSYGGFMTLMCLATRPDVFAAGVSVVGVVNWLTMYEETRGDLREYLVREFGDPAKDAARYRERSPITHADRIKAPLLILQGATDPRVPQHEAEQLVAKLRERDRVFEYHVYPEEGHSFARIETKIDANRRALEWFDRHLKGEPGGPTGGLPPA